MRFYSILAISATWAFDFFRAGPIFGTQSYGDAYEKELEKYSKEFTKLYTSSETISAVDETPLTTETETAPNRPLSMQSRIRKTKSLNQLGSTASKPDDRRWQSAPSLERGQFTTETARNEAKPSSKNEEDLISLQKAIREGDSDVELLGSLVIEMRTNHVLGFSKVSRITDPPSVKAFFVLQQLIVHRYRQKLQNLCESIFAQEVSSRDDLDSLHRTMHIYCEAIDDLEKMQTRTRAHRKPNTANSHDPAHYTTNLTKEGLLRSLVEEVMEERCIAPGAEHATTTKDRLTAVFSEIWYVSILALFKMGMAIVGGLFVIIPMLIVVLDSHRTKASILVVISISIFILITVLVISGFITEIIRIWVPDLRLKAMDVKDMLTIVTAYAAVLMVFVGGYTSDGTERGTIS